MKEQSTVLNQATEAVEFYSSLANLLLDILSITDNASVGGNGEYELKLMCINKLKAIVEKIEV
jgi:hypothetical protein